MEMLKKLTPVALVIAFIGALNWGILGITGGSTNVLAEVFGTGMLIDIVYTVIGIAGLVLVPRLLEELHLGGGAHPREA